MSAVSLLLDSEFLGSMLCLGDREIVNARWRQFPSRAGGTLQLIVNAPDAPEGCTEMNPLIARKEDGMYYMLDPGFVIE